MLWIEPTGRYAATMNDLVVEVSDVLEVVPGLHKWSVQW